MPSVLVEEHGTLLGRKLRLIRKIGRGGMGDVWVALNTATEADVAVKILRKDDRTDLRVERFRREARLAAATTHRNIVHVFDLIDEPDGTLGLMMELLRGSSVDRFMKNHGPFSNLQAVAVAAPILGALDYVHRRGIIHRDLKPANIFLAIEPDDHVIPKILDFGIARPPAGSDALTTEGSVLGTPHYMSPEQVRGEAALDGRSDMFSFAVVVYEMLSGVRLFERESASGSLAAVLESEVDPHPSIEPRLWVALGRALSKRPSERYATCAQFADALRAAVGASDHDLVTALRDLRPDSDAPLTEEVAAGAVASSVSRRRRSAIDGKWGWAAAACAAVAVVLSAIGFSVVSREQTPNVVVRPAAPAMMMTPQSSANQATVQTPPSSPDTDPSAAKATPSALPGARPAVSLTPRGPTASPVKKPYATRPDF